MALGAAASMVLVTAGATAATAERYDDATLQVVAEGLANPRGLTIVGDKVLVAEAGKGGDGPCLIDGVNCLGATGGVTLYHPASATSHRIVTGLPSLAPPTGANAIGLTDLSVGPGGSFGILGLSAAPSEREALEPGGALLGQVVRFKPDGPSPVGDLAAFEGEHDPDGTVPFTNPYAVAALPGGVLATDAGGNSLVSVGRDGGVELVTVFPTELVDAPPFLGLPPGVQIPMEPVPTSVMVGPDGAYYVGLFTGFPFPVGGATVWRIGPGGEPAVHARGFTNIIDIDFDQQGRLWVLEHAANGLLSGDPTGALTRIEHDGTRTVVASQGLVFPGGLAVASDGSVYVTNNSTSSADGQLLWISP